jgi:WD40 repeat protein
VFGIVALAFSPDGTLLAANGEYGIIQLWNLRTRQPAGAPIHTDAGNVYDVAFSPDGKLLASAGEDGYVRFWNPLTGHPVGGPLNADPGDVGSQFFGGGVFDVEFSPDGKLLASGGGDGDIRLWNLPARQLAGPPIHADPEAVDVAFSPGGKLLASAGGGSGEVGLWDPLTEKPVGKAIFPNPEPNPMAASRMESAMWPSAPTASSWLAPTETVPCDCGIRLPASRSAQLCHPVHRTGAMARTP